MDSLIALDQRLLIAINNMNCPFMDQVMWYISTKWLWIPLYIFMAWLLYRRLGWKQTLFMLIGFAIAVGLSDYITSGILKPLVARFRPTRDPAVSPFLHIVNNYRGGRYGFPSSHAANSMCVAVLFSLLWSRHKKSPLVWGLLITWACIVAYSRMYLGVHYPLDILTGFIVGALVALGVAYLLRVCEDIYHKHSASD